jgi:hypothetical protein
MRRHGVDSQGNKQEMMTLIQAYWDISSRRFIDNVCMNVEKFLLHQLIDELEMSCTLFSISIDDKKLMEIMKEDETITKRRLELKQRIQTLESSLDVLTNYMNNYGIESA